MLVVDDNRDAADSLVMLLRRLGARAVAAYDGRGAIESILRDAPAAALVDIGMAGIDGHEVARRVRARTPAGALHLVALTGWGADEDRQASRAAGFDDHLVKPVAADELVAVLARGRRA